MLQKKNNPKGFTLLEILMALFIFTLVAMIMTHGLRTVFSAQSGTEKKAAQLAELQTALVLVSRDLEQTLDRPITNSQGTIETTFIGTKQNFTFSHAGLANPLGRLRRSTLQRTEYIFSRSQFIRRTWPVLDQANTTKPDDRVLLDNINDIRFEYVDEKNKRYNTWPLESQPNASLPKAVRIIFKFNTLGTLSQLYLIGGQTLGKPS